MSYFLDKYREHDINKTVIPIFHSEKTLPQTTTNDKMASRQPVMRIPAQERYYPELVRRCLELNAFLADLAFQCG